MLRGSGDGVIFDQRHGGSPIVSPDPLSPTPPWKAGSVHAAALAGHRLPHAWITPHGALSDHLGPWFTLVVGGGHPQDPSRFVQAAREAQVPLSVVQLPTPAARAVGRALVLVRPDGVVAWSGDHAPADPFAVIVRSIGAEVGPSPQAAAATSAVPGTGSPRCERSVVPS